MNIFNNIIKNQALRNISEKLLITILVIFISLLLMRISKKIIGRIFSLRGEKEGKFISQYRLRTMESLLSSMVSYGILIILFLYILSVWFGTIGITLAGVGGIALGFGAQSLIKDIIAGIFIIIEDKYKIGDFVTLNGKSGFIDEIGMRTTKLKDLSGEIHMVPNGSVEVVTNGSTKDRRILVEIPVDFKVDINKVKEVIEEVLIRFSENHDNLLESPKFIGVVGFNINNAIIRVQGRTNFNSFWNYENELRELIIESFNKNGISIREVGVEND